MSTFDQTPDRPQGFGYKVLWFAVRDSDPAAVIDALGLEGAVPANWASGLAAACPDTYAEDEDRWMFVSPPVNGWVLAVGSWLPYPTGETQHDIGRKFDALFSLLMARYDDAQFFGSNRVSDLAAWGRAVAGKPARLFSYVDGQVVMNIGDQTPEEAKLGLPDLSGLSPIDAGDRIFSIAEEQDIEEEKLVAGGLSREDAQTRIRADSGHAFPDENDVIDLAARWSIDPTALPDQDHPTGVGLAVMLPEGMRQ